MIYMKNKLILFAFAVSNMASLIYQISWIKSLSYVFGTSVYAMGIVLSCFMAGLAFGSFVIGKRSDKYMDLVKLFAYIEITIGLYALVTPFLFSRLQYPYGVLNEILGNSWMFYLMLSYLTFAILIIPTGLIGGTFPLMNRIYTKRIDNIGADVGLIYSIDTVFAAIGGLAAGFLLIPWVGINGTITAGALLNIGAGIILFMQVNNSKFVRIGKNDLEELKLKKPFVSYISQYRAVIDRLSSTDKVILVGFFFSGFAALASEVVWTRFLSLALGTSIYALSIITATFLIGLSLGSFIAGKYINRYKDLVPLFAYVECGIGISSLLMLVIFDKLDLPYLYLYHTMDSFYPFMFALFILIFIIMMIPTLLMGTTLPLVSKIITSRIENVGMEVGAIFSLNTFGAIYGSFLASFMLIPMMGITKTGAFSGLVNILIGFIVFVSYARTNDQYSRKRFYSIALVAVILFLLMWVSTINPLFAGVYYHGTRMDDAQGWKDIKINTEVLYHDEGLYSSVSVMKEDGYTSLRINGKTDSSNIPVELFTQYMLAYIPLFASNNLENVMMVGLGGGFTLDSISNFNEVKTIDVVEINPLVVSVTKEYFSQYNNHALNDSRVNLIIADARNHLLTKDKKYDVIISEPSNIWSWGEGGLFTREMYEIVMSDLNEGGIFCQWMPLFEQNTNDFKIFLSTFQSVFPYTDLWIMGSDAILIGSNEPINYDYGNIRNHVYQNENINKDFMIMSNVLVTQGKYRLLNNILIPYWMSNDDIKSFSNGVINTDNLPILEFSTAKNTVYLQRQDNPIKMLSEYLYRKRGDLTITPPMVNTTTNSGNKISLDLMDVELEMPDRSYRELFAGFRVDRLKNMIYTEAAYSYGEIMLSINAVVYDDFPVDTEKENMIDRMKDDIQYPINDEQETSVNGHWAYQINSSYMDKGNYALVWYCGENDLYYTVSLDFKNSRTLEAKSILDAIMCVHK